MYYEVNNLCKYSVKHGAPKLTKCSKIYTVPNDIINTFS